MGSQWFEEAMVRAELCNAGENAYRRELRVPATSDLQVPGKHGVETNFPLLVRGWHRLRYSAGVDS